MDRIAGGLDRGDDSSEMEDQSSISLTDEGVSLDARATMRLAIPQALFALNELDVHYDEGVAALWTFMAPSDRPSFTPSMLSDFEHWQRLISQGFGPGGVPLRYLILGSRSPGVFCFGGDLELFYSLIRAEDRDGLIAYGYRCVEILNRNINALDLPMVTFGLVQGQALGGGFEALLSFDFIVAERGSRFGLPEVAFGLFPGMGAHALLSRKLGTAMADRLILKNETYSAEDMYDLGIVHHLAEPGEGVSTMHDLLKRCERRHVGLCNARKAMRIVSPVLLEEMKQIVELWADTALHLRDQDLKMMRRLAEAQVKLAQAS